MYLYRASMREFSGSLSENVYGRDPLSSYGIGQYGQVSPERKDFLDSRKNLVGILTESRYGQNSVTNGPQLPQVIFSNRKLHRVWPQILV
jgi:hypothetical protein